MNKKLLLLTLLLAILSISASKQELSTVTLQQKLIGTWQLKQVKEIGNWSIHHRTITASASFEKITFKQGSDCSITKGQRQLEGKWQLESTQEPNYLPSGNIPVLYYPEKTLTLDGISVDILPVRWEDIVVSKKKLIFSVHHKKGKLKYTLGRV